MLKKEKIDIAFIVLHGGWGEDGSIQGLLEVMGIPYTGSDVISSAIAMNKSASKKIFLYHKIPVPPFMVLDKRLLAISYQLSALKCHGLSNLHPKGQALGEHREKIKDRLKALSSKVFMRQ